MRRNRLFINSALQPYYHLDSESFWRLVPKDKPEGTLKKDKVNYSISHLREEFLYALCCGAL